MTPISSSYVHPSSAYPSPPLVAEQPFQPLNAGLGWPSARHPVDQALHTTRLALAGVDFLTQLTTSALAGGPQFLAAVKQLGLNPAALDRPTREQIDAKMSAHFQKAVQDGVMPVDPEIAKKWLLKELRLLT